MSNVQQLKREALHKGDLVTVIVRYGNQERYRRARVTEVVRAAARVETVGPGDFATMRLPFYRFDSYELTPLVVTTEQPRIGDELELIGFGCMGEREARRATVIGDGFADGCACHGDSGAPVLNERGELAGLFIGWRSDGALAFTQVTAQP